MTVLPLFAGARGFMVGLLYGDIITLKAIMTACLLIVHMRKAVTLLTAGKERFMKKNIICVALIALSSATFALTPEEKAEAEKENMKMLAQMGLPLPGSGIKVVPRSMLGLTPEEITLGDKEMAEFKEKGFVNKYINRPRELLAITPTKVKREIKESVSKENDSYTGLSANVNQMKLAFTFPGLNKNKSLKTFSDDINVIAAAPKGGFHQKLGGWSGASQFFTHKDIGACSYSVMNVKASNTAAQLAQEDVTYTINNKATILMPVEGSDNSGYLYYVKWYDKHNFHELECANMKYSADINNAVIELAKKIDS